MGLMSVFTSAPSPHLTHYRLSAVIDRHMFNDDLLFPFGAISLQRLDLGDKCSRQLVECIARTVLLGDGLRTSKQPCYLQRGLVNHGHLCRQHRFDTVVWLDGRYLSHQLVDASLIRTSVLLSEIYKIAEKSRQFANASEAKCLHG